MLQQTENVRVKICCIATREEARTAIRAGAAALGLVSAMPSGPGVIPESTIAQIARHIPPGVASFLLTSQTDPDEIVWQQKTCGVNTLQLCDRIDMRDYSRLRQALPGISLVQVIHVTGDSAAEKAYSVAEHVDALLLDSGNPDLRVKELGGTGRTHNWEISRRICEAVRVPVYLAGGLTPANVARAIAAVHPFGVDVCSGVRTDGVLDPGKLEAFIKAARNRATSPPPSPSGLSRDHHPKRLLDTNP